MPLSVGDKLGPYEILALIGAGGMGEVYRARDTKLKRDVALKVLPDIFARDAERMARFQREAEVLASLNHPNIAHLYGLAESDDARALVMELVEGETLLCPLPVETALNYAKQIADALEYAHERGVVHRDLKPANNKITPDGVVKVLDFGLAKAIDDPVPSADPSASPTLTLGGTRAGVILGTAAYMSPEQAVGKPADRRSDIFSFGAVLFEMLSGKNAFLGESVGDILAAVVKDHPDWSKLPRSTPTSVRALLRRCLTKDRKQRLQAIGEARIAIEEAQAGVPLDETTALAGSSRRSITPWAVAAVLAVVAAVTSWSAWRGTRPTERPLMRLNVEIGSDTVLASTYGRLALSPDGTLLAVTIRGADGQGRLGTRRLDQSQVTPLAGTEGAVFPFFFPDGQWIAFTVGGQLKKISVQGGTPVTLGSRGYLGSWVNDDSIIGVLGVATGLSRFSLAGGAPTPLTQLNPGRHELAHRWPQVLPGNETVLFTVYDTSGNYDDSDIDVVSLKTGERKTVYRGGFFARYLPSGHLVFIHQNTLFAAPFDLKRLALAGAPQPVVEDIRNGFDEGGNFDFSQTGTFAYLSGQRELQRSIFWLDSTGHTQPLLPAPGLYSSLRFSPDGKHLAFERDDGQGNTDIWVHDLERDRTSRLTSLPGRNERPVWTPDSRNIVFLASNRTAPPAIYWIRADGSGEAYQVTKDNLRRRLPQAISPDGKRLATLEVGQGNGASIWTSPIEGDADHPSLGKEEPFLETPFNTTTPSFSRDGRWIAYASAEPGKTGVWVRPFPGPGGHWQIESNARAPIWSRKRDELFFLEGRRIMVTGYTATGDSFVAEKPRVWSEKTLLNLGSPPVFTHDVAPDGRVAVVLYPDGTADEKPITQVTFLLNFFDELRRRVPVGK